MLSHRAMPWRRVGRPGRDPRVRRLLFPVHGQGTGLLDAGASLSTGALLALVTGPATG
jgi:hypothetical protein